MINRLGSYLASRPKGAAVLVLTLAVAFVLVLAGLALELSHFGRAPYPSENISLSLVNDKVIYTQEITVVLENETPGQSFPYTGMMIAFQVDFQGGSTRMGGADFGNQSQLSTNSTATAHQVLMTGSLLIASIDITDSTGDGSFDSGDTIAFEIVPLWEDFVYTMGLLWIGVHGEKMAMEVSFAIHDGKLYGWYSQYLNDRPWYD